MSIFHHRLFYLFFFNDTATTEIYTLSLHDALPIWATSGKPCDQGNLDLLRGGTFGMNLTPEQRALYWSDWNQDRKSTRLNSSHSQISYAVFCLKKKKKE